MTAWRHGDRRGRSPLLALALVLPVPSIGVAAAMHLWPGTGTGQALFTAAKIWVFTLPALWHLVAERRSPSWSPPRHGGFAAAVGSGALMAGVIVLAYLVARGGMIDVAATRGALAKAGLARPAVYLGLAAYWVLVNSVLEEYLWRWFVVRQAEALAPSGAAVLVSALGFTVHHLVAAAAYLPAPAVALVGLGVFCAGAWWSVMYLRYRSIWPAWLSHAFADIAVFGCGAHLLFAG